MQGWSYPRIARELGISHSTAHARCQAAIARLHESVVRHADQLRTLQLVQYEAMLASLWEQATTGGARDQLHAMEQLTRVMERIDRVGGTEPPMRKIVWVVDEATLVEARKKVEQETAEVEALIARRERIRAEAIEAPVVGSSLVMDAVAATTGEEDEQG
jgi:hypothetical protein